MTALDELLARIDVTLADCDASTLPPVVKLTRDQLDHAHKLSPVQPPWLRGGTLGDFAGTPIEVVDTVEESTPYLLRHGGIVQPALITVPERRPSWWRRILRRSR